MNYKQKELLRKKQIGKICSVIRLLGESYCLEYPVVSSRTWKFDIYMLKHKIAIEYHGGQYMNNAGHQSITGFGHDMFKLNAAQMLGNIVLVFTTEHVQNIEAGYIVNAIKSAIACRSRELNKHELVFQFGKGKNTRKRNCLKMDRKFFERRGLTVE